MSRVVSVGDMRRLEAAAVERGDSFSALMERAGTAAASVFEQRFGKNALHVVILCGNGNNGGDGFVIALRLSIDLSARITVLRMSGEAATPLAADVFSSMPRDRVEVCDLPQNADAVRSFLESGDFSTVSHVIDAVYGIGFRGDLSAAHRAAFSWFSERACPVLAVDIPSGMRADDGTFDAATLRADVTVMFIAPKPCAVLPFAQEHLGEVIVEPCGVESSLREAYETDVYPIDEAYVKAHLPRRKAHSHKGSYGQLLSVCGCYGMAGAALLSAKAALRCGTGLLHMALPRDIYPIAAGQLWEAVYHPMPATEDGRLALQALASLEALVQGKTAVLIGCGLGQHPETAALLQKWLLSLTVPTILDADGLNLIREHILLLKASKAPMVLTPHPAEAARLLGQTTAEVERDRLAAVKALSVQTDAVVVLKGHRTLIANPRGVVFVNETGCSGMATGGSGDVLSGMIGALLAQGVSPFEAAACGVWLHGTAGQRASARLSETAMLPSDMLYDLACLLSQFETRE